MEFLHISRSFQVLKTQFLKLLFPDSSVKHLAPENSTKQTVKGKCLRLSPLLFAKYILLNRMQGKEPKSEKEPGKTLFSMTAFVLK